MSEPVISDEEINLLNWVLNPTATNNDVRRALSAFLKGRVPPAEPLVFGPDISAARHNRRLGFNACRDIVLKGTKT